MSPIWRALLAALAAHALWAAGVGPIERLLAGVALLGLFWWSRARSATVVGCLLGVATAGALALELRRARHWCESSVLARIQLLELGSASSLLVAAHAEGRPPQRLRVRGSELDRLRACGRGVALLAVDPLPARRNPDDRDALRAAWARGALLSARLVEFQPDADATAGPRVAQWRAAIARRLDRRLAGSGALWRALLLGDRGTLDPSVGARVRKLGLAHLLSLSGMHVALLLGMFAFARPGRRIPLWSLLPLAAWIVLAGSAAALLRSGIMATWVLLERRWQRGARSEDGLAVAAWLDLAAHPQRPADIGWWLSYAATYALIRCAGQLRRPKLGALLASCAASGATLPWSMAVFGQIVWLSPLINVLVAVPFAALMLFGVVVALLGSVPLLSLPLDRLLQAATHVFGALLWLLDRITPEPTGHPGLAGWQWGVCLALWCFGFLPRPSLRLRLAIIALVVLLLHLPRGPRPLARWWTLDVGQGDAGVLQQGGAWLIVDSGPSSGSSTQAERVLLPFLARRNVRDASFAITHGHLDHMGGADVLLRSGRVRQLLLAASDSTQEWARELREISTGEGLRTVWLARGDTLALGSARLPVLWPPAVGAPEHANDRSLVLLAGPESARLLLCGDLEREGEAACLAAGAPAQVVALKLAHHGGDTGSDLPWLQALSPRWALLSCGRVNRYGHPHPAVLRRLEAAGIEGWRTDVRGALEVIWESSGPRLRAQRP